MMYNEFTHSVPPHQLRDPHYLSTHDRSVEASTQSFRNRRVSQLQHVLTQRALPSYSEPSQSPSSSSDFLRAVAVTRNERDNQATEHLLRRKTPNKILSSGYDGTPVDWSHGPSANKHILLSQADGARNVMSMAMAPGNNERPIQPNYHHHGVQVDMWHDNMVGASMSGGYGYVPPLANVLHQAGGFQQHYYNGGYYQSVPIVMPSVWNPNIGPTVSNAQPPFGPYWPNGAYEPYRPAATRDARFNNQFANITLNDMSEWSLAKDDQLRRASDGLVQPPRGNLMGTRSVVRPAIRPPPLTHYATDSFLSRRQDSNPTLLQEPLQRNRSFALPQSGRHSIPSPAYPTPNGIPQQWPQTQQHQLPQSEGSTKTLTQHNLQFRDKTLLWAHKIYLNLLTAVQQIRKVNNQGKPADRRNIQMPFFPKPPKYTSISLTTIQQMFPTQNIHGYHAEAQPTRTTKDNSFPENVQWNPEFVSKHSIPIQNGMRPMGTHYSQSYGAGGYGQQPIPVAMQEPQPSAVEAQSALDMLARLAAESNWQWIDGMLLGGCLAYGLGDHRSAHEWYSRVLACDPHHVEGMSNLAATLAILGQFREAEQYWVSAVKLRPSYFEAVEHLIGLLCQDQRARDAVKVLEYVEHSLRSEQQDYRQSWGMSGKPISPGSGHPETVYRTDQHMQELSLSASPVVSGYNVPAAENGRLIALIHAKGNMLYGLGDNVGASRAFEDAIMVSVGKSSDGIHGLIKYILQVFRRHVSCQRSQTEPPPGPCDTILLAPDVALKTTEMMFPDGGVLPGFRDIQDGPPRRAAISVASNALLSLAKIYQDGMTSTGGPSASVRTAPGIQDILALYYMSLSLQPSPSTANNVGILLAGVQQSVPTRTSSYTDASIPKVPGVAPGSGIALALAYYNYGLNLDSRHAHLYTNLGSLLKDIGQLNAAIKMYEQAVSCDGNFDIALANLANAVKDQGRISEAIGYYRRAVASNGEFAEAVCGLANALNSVCQWTGRGGIFFPKRAFDRWHVDETGMLVDARNLQTQATGWIGRVVTIVERQLNEGKSWGKGVMQTQDFHALFSPESPYFIFGEEPESTQIAVKQWLAAAGRHWEGSHVVRLVERAIRVLQRRLYKARYIEKKSIHAITYRRPALPAALSVPTAPTVLPFHTFTCPLTASQIRRISQRNALRISVSTLRAPWLSGNVLNPPAPPSPCLNVGYVSSDFNNHPLAHLMQSVFGMHDRSKVQAFCYATTASDNSSHREQIQKEAPYFRDASSWPVDRLVQQIVNDNIHILINLNGYTRGAKNEVFAARPAPIQMSFMGFAGTLGAEWCDYLLADTTAVPPSTLRPYRDNVDLLDLTQDRNYADDSTDWVYGENLIFTRDTFFCCDHRQSAPDAKEQRLTWNDELERRSKMRKDLFPDLPEDAIILGNFNQLYKIEPTTFRTWLRILQNVPTARLWLLRFPELGETNIREAARQWAGPAIAERIIFTDVAPKQEHISRARICDLFLDTPECNAHTTAADVLWSGTPLLTLPRYNYKMCSRMAASILKGALPRGQKGERAAADLIAVDEGQYEEFASRLAGDLAKVKRGEANGCRLLELRRLLYEGRWSSPLFDTRRWVRDLEEAYQRAWAKWENGEGGDIWLKGFDDAQ